MSEQPDHAPAREVSEYRREYRFSAADRAALTKAAADGSENLNDFWAAKGQAMGFLWTTVEAIDEVPISQTGRFTAEVPDVVPPRDDSAALAFLRESDWHLDDGPETTALCDIWHAGRESGFLARNLEEAALLVEFRNDLADLRGIFDMRFSADMRAIERWQAGEPDPAVRELLEAAVAALDGCHGGADVIKGFARLRAATLALPATWREPAHKRELMWPDHADLVCWLLAKVEAMEAVPLFPSTAEAEAMESRLDRAGMFGVSQRTALQAADVIDGLLGVVQAQQRKLASLRLQSRTPYAGWNRGGPAYGALNPDGSYHPMTKAEWDEAVRDCAHEFGPDVAARMRPAEPPCDHRWPAAGFFRVGQLMNCEICGKRGMMVDPGAAGDAMAEMSAAVPVRRSAPLDRGNERTTRQGILNHEIAQAYEAPDWNEAMIADMVRATAPGWTYSIDWARHPHKPPTVVLLDYDPDSPL